MSHKLPLALIVATTENNVIGLNNKMPWHLPEDLKYFKRRTLGKPVIMGRKTWESLGRPLPSRLNIVVSRQVDLTLEGAEVFADLKQACQRAQMWAQQQAVDEVMIIGGAQLYQQALPIVDRVYRTRIHMTCEGDAFFPELDEQQWHQLEAESYPARESLPAYTFEVWQRV
ncbi:dihydrofolate reductase [Pseudomonas sp. F1_0610]|uniref:dihydrofolate reductase n=1 Tax=Pseudomonas sp. F1_0610 TaxID=3114284 RepID=UPI0039C1BFB7